MSNRNIKEKIGFWGTILGLITDSRDIVIWLTPVVLSMFTSIALIKQPSSPQVPGLNITLGVWYQFVVLLSGGLVYVHFLRHYWVKSQQRTQDEEQKQGDPLSKSFRNFLWKDLLQFKRPLLLIPILVFIALWGAIMAESEKEGTYFISFSVTIILLLVYATGTALDVIYSQEDTMILDDYLEKWDSDQELQDKWMKRIENEMANCGFVNTLSFQDKIGFSLGDQHHEWQVNWAIWRYFERFEFEKELELSSPQQKSIGEVPDNFEIEFYELKNVMPPVLPN